MKIQFKYIRDLCITMWQWEKEWKNHQSRHKMQSNSPLLANFVTPSGGFYNFLARYTSYAKVSIIKITDWLFILTLLVFTLGCSDSSSGTENQNSQVNNAPSTIDAASKKPKLPEIDIHSAVITNNIEAIKQHVLAGSDLNLKDPFGGSSPIISAALFGKTEIVKILVEAGADINFKNNDGSTALHTAAFFCRPEIVQFLLDNGIDKTIKNNMNATAYDSVTGAFKDVKPVYDMFGQALAPFGLQLDYAYLQKTRPIIAEMLK